MRSRVALVVLLLLNLQSSGHLNTTQFWAISIAEALTILLTRGHYTVDVVLGFLIAYLVFDGDYTFVQKWLR
jgi:hypothetical protein